MEQLITLCGIFVLAGGAIWCIIHVTSKTVSMTSNLENQTSTRQSLVPIVAVVLIAAGCMALMALGKISESGGLSLLGGIVGYVLGSNRLTQK
jgi:hypothetical protein